MTSRTIVSTPHAHSPFATYSQGIVSGDLLFCSGQLPVKPGSPELLSAGVVERARQCLANLDEICRAAGTTLASATHLRVYLTDLDDLQTMDAAFQEFFSADPPARTTIQVAGLPLGSNIEIDAVVRL